MDTKWVKESFDKGKIEILKLARTSRIKIEISSLNKKKDERLKLLGRKVMDFIADDMLDSSLFEPDYSYIKNLDKEISEKEEQLKTSPAEEHEQAETDDGSADDIRLATIEAQKVLTAKSIPVEPNDDEEYQGDKHA